MFLLENCALDCHRTTLRKAMLLLASCLHIRRAQLRHQLLATRRKRKPSPCLLYALIDHGRGALQKPSQSPCYHHCLASLCIHCLCFVLYRSGLALELSFQSSGCTMSCFPFASARLDPSKAHARARDRKYRRSMMIQPVVSEAIVSDCRVIAFWKLACNASGEHISLYKHM